MSVYSMAKVAEDTAQPQGYLIALKDYIPAEALALYLFAIGILTPAADATTTDTGAIKLFCFAIGLMAVAAITINSLDRSNVEKGNGIERLGVTVSEPNRRRGVVILLAWSAFTAYVLATLIPTGYQLASVELTRFAVVIGALWTVVLPGVADKLGVRKMGSPDASRDPSAPTVGP